MGKPKPIKPTYPTPDENTPTEHLMDMIDDTLRNGSNMTRANLCFSLLCERMDYDRDNFPTFRSWYEEELKVEEKLAQMYDPTTPLVWPGRECHPDCVIGPNADHHGTMSYRCMDDDGRPLPFDDTDTMED